MQTLFKHLWTNFVNYTQVGNRFYRFSPHALGQIPAKIICEREGSQLAVADTNEKWEELITFAARNGRLKLWVSVLRKEEERKKGLNPSWIYTNGTKVSLHDVEIMESGSSCYHLERKLRWIVTNYEIWCSDRYPFICQRE
ncbi:uncharacterized protein LOC125030450 [Penaeus chinensis]|uniref:uncharacterized protein LOC125030450 n=1 Tax=Penaeus chinensis TaxID=139456 RepID=UPI001FB691FD|nr:uncharacterized protein LOC125030450 [Penaeus chinensis]